MRIAFVRVSKAGGSTILHHMSRLMGSESQHGFQHPIPDGKNHFLFHAHGCINDIYQAVGPAFYLTNLRDPLARYQSLYREYRERKDWVDDFNREDPFYVATLDGIDGFIDSGIIRRAMLWSYFGRSKDEALENIRYVHYIVRLEHIGKDFPRLLRHLGFPNPDEVPWDHRSVNDEVFSRSQLNRMTAQIQDDIDFYREVSSMYRSEWE